MRKHKWSIGTVVAAVTLGLAGLAAVPLPALLAAGPAEFSPRLALQPLNLWALLAAAAAATLNLRELQTTRLVEFEAALRVQAEVWRQAKTAKFAISLVNLGKSAAAGIDAVVWHYNYDADDWKREKRGTKDTLLSGDSTGSVMNVPWTDVALRSRQPTFSCSTAIRMRSTTTGT